MDRSLTGSRRNKGTWLLGAMVAALIIAVPASPALADRDRGRGRGDDRGRYRDHGRAPTRVVQQHHHHQPRSRSSVSFHIGIGAPIVPVCPPPVVVRRPYYRPAPVVVERRTVVVAPPPPPRVVYVQPEPVYIPAPQPVYAPPPVPQPQHVPAQTTPVAPRAAAVSVPATAIARPVLSDTVPAELSAEVYRSGEMVMVMISGLNTGGEYQTSLAAGDTRAASPEMVLRNAKVSESPSDTEFTVNMSIRVSHPIQTVTIRVADRAYDVPVTVIQQAQ